MNKYTRLFIDESREYIPGIASILERQVAGEATEGDLKEGHRLAHSIKGMALFEEQKAIASLSFAMERSFERMHKHLPADGLTPRLERALAMLSGLVDEVEAGGSTSTDPEEMVTSIEAVIGPPEPF